ncbi:MAG: sugar ABC transporter substrate-binding protein [Actinobacteria bacterium]|nr:sugar ABC transporter substrate-binding protein [Actinomycetota bacterium]
MGTNVKQGSSAVLLLIAITAVAIGGCGGGGSTTSTSGGGGSADVAAAKRLLTPYTGQYNPAFAVDEPLKERPSSSIKVSMLQLASPIGGLVTELGAAAAKTAGVNFTAVKAGASASTAQAAAETVVTQQPDGLILPPFEPSVIANQLQELNENGTFIVGNGTIDGEKYGISATLDPRAEYERIGKVFAAWAVAKHGAETDALLVEHPELSLSPVLKQSFEAELTKLCPACKASSLPIPAEELSATPNKVVSELQANPGINQILAISDFTAGLPAALDAAGLEVGTFVFPGEPQTFEYIKNGEIEGAFATGLATEFYTSMDMVLRSVQGMELTKGEKTGIQPAQILTERDITFDPKYGWEPEPNFVETFEKLWHVK